MSEFICEKCGKPSTKIYLEGEHWQNRCDKCFEGGRMSKKIFMLDVISSSRTLSVEVDGRKTLNECLEIADEMGKDCPNGYIMKIGRYIFAGGEE